MLHENSQVARTSNNLQPANISQSTFQDIPTPRGPSKALGASVSRKGRGAAPVGQGASVAREGVESLLSRVVISMFMVMMMMMMVITDRDLSRGSSTVDVVAKVDSGA